MAIAQDRRQIQTKQARLEIVAKLYKRGYSVRKIRAEVMAKLGLKTYSVSTVHKDIHSLLDEWRESRVEDMDEALQLELERIDDAVQELWQQWEKSKRNYTKEQVKTKALPSDDSEKTEGEATPIAIETTTEKINALGNPAYISEIRQQLAERRKLLGLYAPEKKDISGGLSFANLLVESDVIDLEDEQEK